MASTHSGILDTRHASGAMRPHPANRAGRPVHPPAPSPASPRASSPVPAPSQPPLPAAQPSGQQPKPLDRLGEALRARQYSRRTEQAYRNDLYPCPQSGTGGVRSPVDGL